MWDVNKKLKIAVYDEIQNDSETAARLISGYYEEKARPAEVLLFNKAEEFVGAFRKNSFATVFIGINGMRDVDTAWVVRERDKKCPIVIMSRCGDYSLEGYRLEASDYLLKPLDEQKLCKTLGRLKMI